MSQHGTQACAAADYVWNAIVRRYYFDNPGVGYEGRPYGAHGDAQGHVTVLDDAPAAAHFWYPPENTYRLQTYAVGRDGALYENIYHRTSNTWEGWNQNLQGQCTSAPAAAAYYPGQLWAFCRGTDGGIWGRRWNGSTWLAWTPLYGSAQSGPAATAYQLPDGQWTIAVYVLGWDGLVYENFCWVSQGCIWLGWNSIGSAPGGCTSAPAVATRDAFTRYVFCRGSDSAVWYRKWDGYQWQPYWTSLTTAFQSGPAATDLIVSFSGRVYAYANTQSGNIWDNYVSMGSWRGWLLFGGVCQSTPGASDLPSPPSPAQSMLLCRGTDTNVFCQPLERQRLGGLAFYRPAPVGPAPPGPDPAASRMTS